jgi:hypothetical protein
VFPRELELGRRPPRAFPPVTVAYLLPKRAGPPRFVVSGSAPIRRQPMPVTLVETLAPTPTRLPLLPPLPELPSVPLSQGAAA